MAQYAQQAGRQWPPFGYNPEWPGSTTFVSSSTDFNQPSILDPNESAFMEEFFKAPDDQSLVWGMDQNSSHANFGGQLNLYDAENQTIHNPAVTLSGNSSAHYQTHSNHQHVQMLGHMTEHVGTHSDQASVDDLKAASGLYSMSTQQRQDQSHESNFNASDGGTWGNMGSNTPMMPPQETLQSPLTSSGRQPSNSFYMQAHNHPSLNIQHLQSPQSQQQYLWHQQQQMMSTHSHPRRASLHVNTSDYVFFPHQQAQMRTAQSAYSHAQNGNTGAFPQFGTDTRFTGERYQPPNSYFKLEQEKGANLNNVPFAAQVAASRQAQMQAYSPVARQSPYQGYGLPTSSPSNLGGLPVTSPISTAQIHGHPFHHISQGAIDDAEEDGEDDFDDPRPRKRRKSQMEREDEAEYSPAVHVKAPLPKRGPKVPKATTGDGSDDEFILTPSNNTSSYKRSRSNAAARSSLGSTQSPSPPATGADADAMTTATRKKKKGKAQPRKNLTENEKRQNHIQSEKTRRDLIKLQYDELDRLVPALKGGKAGLSRSDILKEIVKYVEIVANGNQVAELEIARRARGDGGGGDAIAGGDNAGEGGSE